MSAHTPGPWEEVETETSVSFEGVSNWQDIAPVAGGAGPVAIALGYGHYRDDREASANARLIAAAPSLLEAAREGLSLAEADVEDRRRTIAERGEYEPRDTFLPALIARRDLILSAIHAATGEK